MTKAYRVTFIYNVTILSCTVDINDDKGFFDDHEIACIADEAIRHEIGFAPLQYCNDYVAEEV